MKKLRNFLVVMTMALMVFVVIKIITGILIFSVKLTIIIMLIAMAFLFIVKFCRDIRQIYKK